MGKNLHVFQKKTTNSFDMGGKKVRCVFDNFFLYNLLIRFWNYSYENVFASSIWLIFAYFYPNGQYKKFLLNLTWLGVNVYSILKNIVIVFSATIKKRR